MKRYQNQGFRQITTRSTIPKAFRLTRNLLSSPITNKLAFQCSQNCKRKKAISPRQVNIRQKGSKRLSAIIERKQAHDVKSHFRTEPLSGIFTEAECHGKEIPFSYNLPDIDKTKTRQPNFSLSKTKESRQDPLRVSLEPSPVSYEPSQNHKPRHPSI